MHFRPIIYPQEGYYIRVQYYNSENIYLAPFGWKDMLDLEKLSFLTKYKNAVVGESLSIFIEFLKRQRFLQSCSRSD